MVGTADDMYYGDIYQRVYVSGGGGSINIFQQKDANNYQQIANIPTRYGGRTSLLVPQLHLFLLAERREAGGDARLLIYRTEQ